MKFTKPALSLPAQLTKLQSRGLTISDLVTAEHYLRFIGYYRLSAYALPFQQHGQAGKPFKSGVSFEEILNLYRFDRELRLLVMDALERIEVAVRSTIVNEMCLCHGTHWLMDAAHSNGNAPRFRHAKLLNKIDSEFNIPPSGASPTKRHHEVFINHYFAKYTSPYLPPAWMVAETLTLGTWSMIFEHLRVTAEGKKIAANFGVDEQVLRSWLHALTYLRNLCAHHARVWNRQMVIKVIIAKKHASFLKSNDRFYALAVVINDLMQRIAPGTGWHERLAELLDRHPSVDLSAIGFPATWKQEPFWGFPPP